MMNIQLKAILFLLQKTGMAIVICIALFFQGQVFAQTQSAYAARENCVNQLRAASAESIVSDEVREAIKVCTKTPLEGDLSVQMLHFMLGEPVEVALKAFYSFNQDASPESIDGNGVGSMMYPMHETLRAFNWFFFFVLCLTIFNQFFVQATKWAAVDERMSFAKWMKMNGGSSTFSLFLSAPLIGWMTPLQFFAVTVVVFMAYIAKTIVASLFFASFFSQYGVDVAREVKPVVSSAMEETTLIYYCDILEREKLINGVIASVGSNTKSKLEGSGLFQCLTQGAGGALLRNGAADPYNLAVDVVLPAIQNTQQCWLSHEPEASSMGLSKPRTCGSVALNLPRSDAGVDTAPLQSSAQSIYLAESVQTSARVIAMKMHEYLCRKSLRQNEQVIGTKDAGCTQLSASGSGYRYEWTPDQTTGELVLFRHAQPMSSASKTQMKDDIARMKNALSTNLTNDAKTLMSHFDLLAKAVKTGGESVVTQDDAKDLAVRIERGGWLSGSLFFRNISESMDDSVVVQRIAKVYTAESDQLPPLDDLSPIMGPTRLSDAQDTLTSASFIFPKLALFTGQSACWDDPSTCQASALNPFIDMGRQGTALIAESALYYMGAKIVSVSANAMFPVTGRGKLMLTETLSGVYVLYLLIGFSLAFVIPAYPLMMLMGIMVSWVFDVLKALLEVQIAIAQSPVSEHRKAMFSEKVRAAGAQLFGLAGYFLAVMFGVLMTFFTFSFFYGFNGLIVGWLSSLVGWAGEAHAMEGIVITGIKDVLMTFILFYEVKLCVPFIQRIPQAYLERFQMHMTDNEHVAEMLIRSIRGHIIPGVSQFISNGKMVALDKFKM